MLNAAADNIAHNTTPFHLTGMAAARPPHPWLPPSGGPGAARGAVCGEPVAEDASGVGRRAAVHAAVPAAHRMHDHVTPVHGQLNSPRTCPSGWVMWQRVWGLSCACEPKQKSVRYSSKGEGVSCQQLSAGGNGVISHDVAMKEG